MNLLQFKKTSFSNAPHFLLLGNPVAHSLSPLMHNTAAKYYDIEARYYAVRVESAALSSLSTYLNNDQLRGANVTIPYKQAIMDFVDKLDAPCSKIGALNTIVKKEHRLIGYNTDLYGFCAPLSSLRSKIEGSRTILFGTGGAARAIAFGLMDFGIEELVLVSRYPGRFQAPKWPHPTTIVSYDAWPSYAGEASLIVNATPLGLEPHIERSPVKKSESFLLSGKICYDIVYKPMQTTFLKQAECVNAQIIGGLEMLIQQGSRAFELWTGKPFPIEMIRNKLKHYLQHGN